MSIGPFIFGVAVGGFGVWYHLKRRASEDLADRDREMSRLCVELATAQQALAYAATEHNAKSEAKTAKPKTESKTAANGNQAKADDLTRIKGIGKVLASRLNNMGITNFEQIAAFKAADIERIKREINSRGAGDPSNWINQARLLMKKDQSKP
jgi:predicted flap endonuclease-1-like 5' DNA nuclease